MRANIVLPYRLPGVFNDPEGIVRSGLVAHYRFDQGRGQTLWDYSGFKNHGTLNGPTWTPQGLSYDGVNNYVNVGNIGKEMRTLQIVFYNNNTVNAALAGQGLCGFSSGAADSITLGTWTGFLTDEILTISSVSGSGRSGWCHATDSIAIGWHISDFVWDGSKYRIILDGSEKPITVSGTPGILTATAFLLGAQPGPALYFNGKQAYCLLYNRSLTDAEFIRNRQVIKAELAPRGVILAA